MIWKTINLHDLSGFVEIVWLDKIFYWVRLINLLFLQFFYQKNYVNLNKIVKIQKNEWKSIKKYKNSNN